MKALLTIFALILIGNAFANDQMPELVIEKIQQDVYLHKSFSLVDGFGLVSSNGLVVIEDAKAFIVDTPWSDRDTENLAKWIKGKNYKLIGSISTHSHEDRTAGIKWLNARSIPTYASTLTNELLERDRKELALNTFEESEFLFAGGLVEAFYPGGGHTIDNIVVWLPKSKVLFGGCFVRSLDSMSLGYTGEADIEKWPDSVENVLSRYPDAKLVVPGHGRLGDVRLLEHTKTLAESASNKSIQSTAKASAD